MFRKIFTIMVLFSLVGTYIFAQSTGRIAGKVIDQQTGAALVGANVLIVGTTYGAATDVNGEYIIPQIPAGVYSVRASYLGYQNVIVKDIHVVSGLTQSIDFKLPSSAIATKEVVIVSKRPLIQKSATNAIRIVTAEDIQALPVRTVSDIIALQPGVVKQNGVTYIRGSRADETGYILEGADVKNVVGTNGGSLITTTPDALQEVTVQAGGYTAEYGNANAGIVQEDFKTGTDQYHVSLRAETDNFGNFPDKKFLGTYTYGYSDYVVTLSGPVFTNKLKVFLSGENYFIRDYSPRFLYANPTTYSDGAPFATTKIYDSGALGGNPNDSQILTWNAGNVPGRMNNRYTLNGTALLDMKPLLLRFAAAFTNVRQRNNDNVSGAFGYMDISNIYDLQRLPITDQSNLLLNLKGTYFLGSASYLEANINYLDWRNKTYDPYFKDNFLQYSDSTAAAQYGWVYQNYTSGPAPYDFYGFPFERPGAQLTNIGKDHRNYIGASLSYTTQFEKHEFKAGGSFKRWTIRHYGAAAPGSILNGLLNNPDYARNTDSLSNFLIQKDFRDFNNFGYDIFGNETDAYPFQAKHPIFASGYVQDRFELNDLIINAGLRFDYFNMDSYKFSNAADPYYNDKTKLIPTDSLQTGDKYSYVSPRLGFSFPVTDRTVFHMQYGKFVQAPALADVYAGMLSVVADLKPAYAITAPTAYNPAPVRTTQYEIGFTQQFTDFAAFDITAFYKDIRGQLQYYFYPTVAGALVPQNYATLSNQDFSSNKGLELKLTIRRIDRVRAEINYTYNDSKGTNSFATSGFGSVQVNNNVPSIITPLAYDQTHRGSIMLDYRFGKDDGGPILQQLGLNLLFTFNSGHPYTLAQFVGLGQNSAWTGGIIGVDTRERRPNGAINSATTPWDYNLDLRIDKTVSMFNFDVNFYVYVQNVLDTKNVINVYNKTGNAYDDGFLASSDAQTIIAKSRYTQRFADLYRALNLGNREAAISQKGYDMFGTPRQLRAGVLINF